MTSELLVVVISLIVLLGIIYILWQRFTHSNVQVWMKYYPNHVGGTMFHVVLRNEDAYSIQIARVLLRLESGETMLYPEVNNPIVLQSGETREFWFPLYDYKEAIRSDPLAVKRAEVYLDSGECFTFPSLNPNSQIASSKLKQEVREHWTP